MTTWTDHADYLDSLAADHRDDPTPKPYAPAPITWRITWTYLDAFGDDLEHETVVLAPRPRLTDHPADALPDGMRRWADWIGRANYRDDLRRIEYALEHPTDLTGVTFDAHGMPHVTETASTTTIHSERYR